MSISEYASRDGRARQRPPAGVTGRAVTARAATHCAPIADGGGLTPGGRVGRRHNFSLPVHTAESSPSTTPPIVHDVLRSSGHPLPPAVQADLGSKLGHDFSDVRVHTDAAAASSAWAVGALAYTVGYHVAFGAGRYEPATTPGLRLLAHELTHVVQQRQAGSAAAPHHH